MSCSCAWTAPWCPSAPCTSRGRGKKTDLWFLGKHHRHGANIQVLADSSGFPVWVSPAEPGQAHDIVAARAHGLPALYKASTNGLLTLADKSYTGVGTGIKVSVRGGPKPDGDTRWRNYLITSLRAPPSGPTSYSISNTTAGEKTSMRHTGDTSAG